jgi:alpha-glucosidase (family GH31 glycosyl hydrolase)
VALGAPGADLHSGDFGLLPAVKLPAGVSRLPEAKEASWATLKESVHALLHAGFSATLVSAFDVGPYLGAGAELRERAAQLAGVAPLTWMSRAAVGPDGDGAMRRIEEARKRLTPFFVVYAQEARERGFPIVQPVAMHFHTDAEAWKCTDEFMLGDELLVAPVVAPGGRRSVYFPRGVWTDLRTNRVYKSRQTAEIQAAADELPMFGRNGAILPIAPLTEGQPWRLHYFPKLAAEFFVLEEDLSDYTQLHASPAVETVRLEIESLKDRDYEWVVHHTGPCKRVAQVGGAEFREGKSHAELAPGRWFHDRTLDNLHVRTQARAGEHHVVSVWLEAVWN